MNKKTKIVDVELVGPKVTKSGLYELFETVQGLMGELDAMKVIGEIDTVTWVTLTNDLERVSNRLYEEAHRTVTSEATSE